MLRQVSCLLATFFGRSIQNLVNQSVGFRIGGCEIVVTLGIPSDSFDGLTGVTSKYLVQQFASSKDVFGLDFNIRNLTTHLPIRLMDHHF